MKTKLPLLLLPLLLFACAEEPFDPTASFTKVYDNSTSTLDYQPIDIVETSSGYLILASRELPESDFSGIQVIQLDEGGNFLFEQTPSDQYVAPVRDFIRIDSTYYFFAMDGNTFSTVLFSMDAQLNQFDISPITSSPNYPLATSVTETDELLLLSYDPDDQESVISRYDASGSLLQGNGYSIGPGSDVEAAIVNHFVDPEQSQLPFFIGEMSSGQVYFNSFYNYNLSLVFSSFADEPTGVLQGQITNAGITKATYVAESSFALFGYQFDDNFILPKVSLNTTGIGSSVDLLDDNASEFKSRTNADIVIWTHNEVQYAIVAGDTENGQVALYIYDYNTGSLKAIEKVGYLNTHNLAAIKIDSENGLLIVGSTYVSGRFKRIFLKKMKEDELVQLVK